MKNNFMIALYSLIKAEYLYSFILWATQNSSCPRVNVYLTAQFTFQGQKKRHQSMHLISQAQVWSSSRFLHPDLLSAMKPVHSSIETTTPAPTPDHPLLLALTTAGFAPRTAVPPGTVAVASSLAVLPPRHAPDLHTLPWEPYTPGT